MTALHIRIDSSCPRKCRRRQFDDWPTVALCSGWVGKNFYIVLKSSRYKGASRILFACIQLCPNRKLIPHIRRPGELRNVGLPLEFACRPITIEHATQLYCQKRKVTHKDCTCRQSTFLVVLLLAACGSYYLLCFVDLSSMSTAYTFSALEHLLERSCCHHRFKVFAIKALATSHTTFAFLHFIRARNTTRWCYRLKSSQAALLKCTTPKRMSPPRSRLLDGIFPRSTHGTRLPPVEAATGLHAN